MTRDVKEVVGVLNATWIKVNQEVLGRSEVVQVLSKTQDAIRRSKECMSRSEKTLDQASNLFQMQAQPVHAPRATNR